MDEHRQGHEHDVPTEAEWLDAFVSIMVHLVGPMFEDGRSVEDYGRQIAPSYYADEGRRADGPRACVEEEVSLWADD